MTRMRDVAGPLWAVTCFYNPVRYRNRLNNYRRFRQSLGVPLVAVELSFDGRFELETGDAEILLQLTGGDVMWQKERLLNIALAALPNSCRYVLLVDCDVVFCRGEWAEQVCRRLEHCALLQPFSRVHHLNRDATPEQFPQIPAQSIRPSVAWFVAQGVSAEECLGNPTFGLPEIRSPGHAWAARREVIELDGLYDACIIGGGDTSLACGAFGVSHVVPELHAVNPLEFEHYQRWAKSFFQSVRGDVSVVEGDLLHLWHGEISNRRTRRRHQEMAAFQFDPSVDIALSESGCWRWNSPKREMHEYVADYFVARNEDGAATMGVAAGAAATAACDSLPVPVSP